MFSKIRSKTAGAVATTILLMPLLAGAHGDADSKVAQNPALLAAMVTLGGGAEHFSARTLRQALGSALPDEDRALRTAMGSANVDRFDEVFTYVVNDGVGLLKRSGKSLPAPASTDPKTVAASLYQAGLHDGAFDVEHVFDALFSPQVHSHAMVAVARKYGQAGETAYHTVFARLVQDTGK